MLRANFFFKLFQSNKSSNHEIVQYISNENFSVQEDINIKIIEIDQKISENSKALFEAQLVKLRSTFSKSNSFIDQLGKNVYNAKLEDSINWYQKEIRELYLKRRELEINQEKLKGIFWLNRIKRLLRIMLIGFVLFLSLFIFLSGFMIIIYLMPLIILILLGYLIFTKRY